MNDIPDSRHAEEIWQAAKGELQLRVARATYDTWLRDSHLVAYEDGTFIIGVPNAYAKDWLEYRLHGVIKRVLEGIAGRSVELRFTVRPPGVRSNDADLETPLLQEERRSAGTATEPGLNGRHLLNPRYTFETFIVGENNRLAHAAALSVTDYPGREYNPLFIYGGVGLGKTHLLHAIGHRSLARGADILYVTSEEFTNDLIRAIRMHDTESFRRKYRTADILLIDDIQFIAGKESTQEEFFHTFNALHAAEKQIVLTSDRPPKAMTTLEERLRSRFDGGLCVDIKPPDLEVRAAILEAKAAMMGVALSQEIVMLIAQQVRTNIRDLEGVLNRVVVEARVRGVPITTELVLAVLEDLQPAQMEIPPEQLIAQVAQFFGLSAEQLTGRGRNKEVSLARQMLMYLLRNDYDFSYPQIGHLLNRDHTTVMHGVEKMRELIETDDAVHRRMMALRERLFAKAG
ncbi:MAG TPA: chromosomal replication initiator protein DnaA [Caldilineae bacterium]|nr:chromosomal replication initiator protein DnaA [Caldilineae bacterium]